MSSTLVSSRKPIGLTRFIVCAAITALLANFTSVADAKHAPATKLLPKQTVLYVSVPDTTNFVEKFKETALGRMSEDPQLKPIVKDLYGSVAAAMTQVEEEVGLSLDNLLSLPQGELTLALTVPTEGPMAVVLLLDVGEQMPAMQKLLDRGLQVAQERGATKSEETIHETEVHILQPEGRQNRQIMYFQKEGSLVIGSNKEVMSSILEFWKEGQEEALRNNQEFSAIMNRCRGSKTERPQMTWFIDPLNLAKTALENNAGAQVALALFPVLGLDGLKGVGGSMTFATSQFDSVVHTHLLLDNPRAGVIELLAMKSGDTKPETWVSEDVTNYTTFHWSVEETYQKLASLVDSFQGEGAFSSQVQNRLDDLEINLEEEILPVLDGRFTYVSWMEPPATIASGSALFGIRIKDTEKFSGTMDKLLERFADRITKDSTGGKTYYKINRRRAEEELNEQQRRRQACFMLFGDYLLIADRPSFLEKAVLTAGGVQKKLADSVEFKLISSKISRQPGGEKPGLVSFQRPEEGMKWIYEMATSDNAKQFVQERSEENPLFRELNKNMADREIPPFSVLQQYLAPGGSMMTDDETGIHYMSFTLKRDPGK